MRRSWIRRLGVVCGPHTVVVSVGLAAACAGESPARPDAAVAVADAATAEVDAIAPGVDAAPADDEIAEDEWAACAPSLATLDSLRALPGEGVGGPVITSNNPELFDGDGLLYGIARASSARGGASFPLDGAFGVYLHHVNRAGSTRYVSVVVTNPGDAPVTVSASGSGYTQDETGGLPIGGSPDYRVSADWITDDPATVVGPTELAPFAPLLVWRKPVGHNREVDGRFAIDASGPVYVYVVATTTDDLNEAITDGLVDAPGDIRAPGTPPPPFGREAGVYAHDTWAADIAAAVPGAPGQLAFAVNTATGVGHSQVQAFPALTHYADSAAEAVGMYGNVYDVTVRLRNPSDTAPRTARVDLSALGGGTPSRFWDGVATVDGATIDVQLTPSSRTTTLATVDLAPGEIRAIHIRAMVPGLTSVPQALLVTTCP